MNPFHDAQGKFSEGGGGGVPASRMNRFVTNSNSPDRQQWMGERTRNSAYHPSVHDAQARQDQNASRAHAHVKEPVFGKRGR